ncbi:hypothetical protein HHI36_005028 [Cryptolaemus montrouzieri]|uniref:Uncharacterized protein n=1 Tax=Cryptolaemus montrouzieri TaxID=559131 RepID=A0ABD2NTC9_9CUCU
MSKTRKDLQSKINPVNLGVGISMMKNMENGNILLKCTNEKSENKKKAEIENERSKTNLNADHNAEDENCVVYKMTLQRIKERTYYGSISHTHPLIEYSTVADYNLLENYLGYVNWNVEVLQQENVHEAFDSFINTIKDVIQKCTKILKKCNKYRKRNSCITVGIIKPTATKNTMYKETLKRPNDQDLQNRHFKQELEKKGNSPGALWDWTRTMITCQSCQNKKTKEIKNDNGEFITEEKIIASFFDDHYSTVEEKLASRIKRPNKPPVSKKCSLKSSMFFEPVTEHEIAGYIDALMSKKLQDLMASHPPL